MQKEEHFVCFISMIVGFAATEHIAANSKRHQGFGRTAVIAKVKHLIPT